MLHGFSRKVRLHSLGRPKYITRPYLLEDYKKDCASHNVKGIVHIEAGWKGKGPLGSTGETKWLKSINSTSSPNILAIVVNLEVEIMLNQY